MARKEEPKIQPNNELEQKIIEAFEVFDHSGKQVVDVREIGTILRSLGCCPTEAEVQEVILATENKEATGNVPLINFLPYMCKAMIEHRFYPASAEILLAAFRYFDKDGRGYLTKERFTQLMLEEGEPFSQEEFDEMMQTALDPVTSNITYEYYINQLMVCTNNLTDTNNFFTVLYLERKKTEPLSDHVVICISVKTLFFQEFCLKSRIFATNRKIFRSFLFVLSVSIKKPSFTLK
ncbi:EF-hand calcium-binding domain-containing protein 2 [Papilio xuthus]|uniref:EF-hand calcium-binding domain-containing protein 2 n=1 Tax=Papilio xuthus TaxID=66420 RepID=A0A194QHH1_PAPXU|nr:EF-hand calcium-binding domain-containing protein 2 [Papilio xuthus]